MIDNIMVGKLDPTNLAAVSLGNSFIFIAMSIGIGFSAAITPVVAEAHSKKHDKDLMKSFVNGFILCLFLGCFLYGAILLFKPLLNVLDQPQNVVELAIPYLDIVALSLIPLLMFQALKQFSDGLSLTANSMYATILANVVNVIINYVLILCLFFRQIVVFCRKTVRQFKKILFFHKFIHSKRGKEFLLIFLKFMRTKIHMELKWVEH